MSHASRKCKVFKGYCRVCGPDFGFTWLVTDPSGQLVGCSRKWTTAMAHANGRAAVA